MEEKSKSYVLGVIGGLIGGFIATIPWIMMYVYGEMILSLLAIIIALGVLKGYQLFKGKVDKKLPIIIVVISVISVTVATLLIIPCLLLIKDGEAASIENLKILYQYDEFVGAIIKDYAISVVFTFLGISGVIANVKKQINEGNTENIKGTLSKKEQKNSEEKIDTEE